MKNFNIDLQRACEGLGITVEKYEGAKELIAACKKERIKSTDNINMDTFE